MYSTLPYSHRIIYIICRYKDLIMKAIADNDFMRNLEPVQINEIVECMYQREFKKEQFVIREGGVGTQLYVISGTYDLHNAVEMWLYFIQQHRTFILHVHV